MCTHFSIFKNCWIWRFNKLLNSFEFSNFKFSNFNASYIYSMVKGKYEGASTHECPLKLGVEVPNAARMKKTLVGNPKSVWFVTQCDCSRWIDQRWRWFRALFYHSWSCWFLLDCVVEPWYWKTYYEMQDWSFARSQQCATIVWFALCWFYTTLLHHHSNTRTGMDHSNHYHQLYGIPVQGRFKTQKAVSIPPVHDHMI